jgi:Phasin protein
MSNALEKVQPQVKAAVQQGFEAAEIALSQIDRATKQAIEHAKQNIEFAKSHVNTLTGVKDPSQIFQLVQQQFEATAQYASEIAHEIYDLNKEFHSELSSFADSHFDTHHTQFNQLIAENLKNAPAGTEFLSEAVKHFIQASNTAVANTRAAVSNASQLAEQTIEQVKGHAVKAKPTARSSRARSK